MTQLLHILKVSSNWPEVMIWLCIVWLFIAHARTELWILKFSQQSYHHHNKPHLYSDFVQCLDDAHNFDCC